MLLSNQNYRYQNSLHQSVTSGILLFLFLTFTYFVENCNAQQKNLINSNKCEEVVGGVTVYKACSSGALWLFRNSLNAVKVTPSEYTCGTPQDQFCPLGFPVTSCSVCNANSPIHKHPPDYLIDWTTVGANTSTWWQSISWIKYPTPLEVNITMSFNKSYELQDDLKITFQGSRPSNMVLEKSSDFGATWEPWQNYDRSCSTGTVNVTHPEIVICTPHYSQATPYSDSQVVFPITRERLGLFLGPTLTNYQKLYEAYNNTKLKQFLTFTDIRIRLVRPMTDGLEAPNNLINLWKYYYAISDISVTASCFCNMHAKYCLIANGTTMCDCKHNTEGVNCERCKPLYNNRQWKPGYYVPYPFGTANPCERCQCNDHAVSCTYNTTLEFGECDNCTHNTTGVHCEKCDMGFYRNPGVLLNSTEVCTSCGCEPLGVIGNNTVCNDVSGQCQCKANITGLRCDTCLDNYYGLQLPDRPGICKECSCNTDGTVAQNTVCNHTTGVCPCKQTTTGRDCGQCKDGFYMFPTKKPYMECLSCNCNRGGSTSSMCDKTTGNCNCRANVTGKTCDGTQPNFYVPALDSFQFQPSKGTCTLSTALLTEQDPFTGKQFSMCAENQYVEFQDIAGTIVKQPNVTWTYLPAVRYNLFSAAPWKNATLEFIIKGSSTVDMKNYPGAAAGCPISTGTITSFLLDPIKNGKGQAWVSPTNLTVDIRCLYTIKLTMLSKGQATSNVTHIDSVVLFPDHESSLHLAGASAAAVNTYKSCVQSFAALVSREDALRNSTCSQLAFSTMSQLTGGSLQCGCNPTGSLPGTTCASVGGECKCKPGVYGRMCDQCAPGYYNFTASGCTACSCDQLGSTTLVCDYNTGQCPCRPNIATLNQPSSTGSPAGLKCNACLKDFFGKHTGKGCQACSCDTLGSNTTQCDDQGVCPCKLTVTGNKCDTCQPGYYSRTVAGCLACNCSTSGSTAITCNQVSGACTCKTNVQGNKCDSCNANSFNLHSENPDGCQRCFCYGQGTQCTSAQGYSTNTLNTLDLSLWTPVNPTGPQVDLTHRPAPAEYLGHKLSSYARFITIEIQSRANQVIQLQAFQPFIIVGNGKMIYYNATGMSAVPTPQTLTFLLHESNFLYNQTTAPDYFNFYAILADVTGIFFQRKFGTNVVDIRNVTMQTTHQTVAVGAAVSNGVENCTCTASRNVRGMSCEMCNQGFKRPTPTSTSYEACVACDCKSRAETTPPLCNQTTGFCLNCKNGTTGNQCEACSANVLTTSGCTTCMDGFWGLSKPGCQACNCNPTGSVSSVCNKATGVCTCKSNVIGEKCDQCADNFYKLTTTGCIECDTCYGLVMNEVNDLRQMRDNLTSFLKQLQTEDNNAQLGPFSTRLYSTLNSIQQLTVFLADAQKIQGPILKDIDRLNITLNKLRYSLDVDTPMGLNQSNITIQNNAQFLGQINIMIGQVNSTLLNAYQTLTGYVEPYTLNMMRAVDALNHSYYQISGASDSSLKDVINLSKDVLNIENTTAFSAKLANDALALVTNTTNHHSNNNKLVSDLQTLVSSTSNLSLLTNTSVYQAEVEAQAVSMDTANATRVLAGLMPIKQDVVKKLMVLVDDIKLTAEKLRLNASTFSPAQIDIKDVRLVKAQNHAAKLTSDISTLKTQSQAIVTELEKLYTDAQTAKNLSDSSLTSAKEMLGVMQNFTTIARDIELKANASLATVQEVTSLSQTASARAQQIVNSLSGTLTNSQTGLKGVQDAKGKADANYAKVQPLTTAADSIYNRYNQKLGDIKFKEQSVIFNNITHISPARQTCDAKNVEVTTLESQTQLATVKATNVSQSVNNSQLKINNLLQTVKNVNTINQKSIDELRTLVLQTRTDYDRRQLHSAVLTLKSEVEAQKVWITNMQARKQDLQGQIQRLKDIKDQLKN